MNRTVLSLALLFPLGCRGEFDVGKYLVADAESGSETNPGTDTDAGSETATESESETDTETDTETETETETETDTDTPCRGDNIELDDGGCFGVRQVLPGKPNPTDLALARFAGSPYVDLALVASGVYVYYGVAGGQFDTTGNIIPNAPQAIGVAVGDIEETPGTDYPDIAVISFPHSTFHLSLGDGFVHHASLQVGGYDGLFADLDDDGDDDLLLTGPNLQLLTNMAGVWNIETFPFDAHAITLGDVNGDGLLDLAYADDFWIWVLINEGDAGFYMSPEASFNIKVEDVEFVDLDSDGSPELLAVSSLGLHVFEVDPDGKISFAAELGVGAAPQRIAVGDIDGDGIDDVVTLNKNSGDLSILRGNNVSLEDELRVSTFDGEPAVLGVADLDDDGRHEIVVGMSDTAQVLVYGYVDP